MLNGSQRRNMLKGARHGANFSGSNGRVTFNPGLLHPAKILDYDLWQTGLQEEATRKDTFASFAARRREEWDK